MFTCRTSSTKVFYEKKKGEGSKAEKDMKDLDVIREATKFKSGDKPGR